MAFVTDNRTATASLADRVSNVIAGIQDYRAKRKLYRTTFDELSMLSNAELADIGLSRSMIRSVALDAAGMK